MNQEDSQKSVISIKPGRVFLIMSDFGGLLRRFCVRKTRWSSGKEHKLFEQDWTQLPKKQINTTARVSNRTIKASFCASAEQTVVFQDKRSSFSKRSNAKHLARYSVP